MRIDNLDIGHLGRLVDRYIGGVVVIGGDDANRPLFGPQVQGFGQARIYVWDHPDGERVRINWVKNSHSFSYIVGSSTVPMVLLQGALTQFLVSLYIKSMLDICFVKAETISAV